MNEALRRAKLPTDTIYRKGELRRPSRKKSQLNRPNKFSGFMCVIGKDNDKTIDQYVKDAIRFLKKHEASLKKMSKRKDVETMTI
ncbi:MAG TPA: hypothetical protein VH681_01650, partial [Nitrospiraceae bacterium]